MNYEEMSLSRSRPASCRVAALASPFSNSSTTRAYNLRPLDDSFGTLTATLTAAEMNLLEELAGAGLRHPQPGSP